ncbi:MAG: carbon storage regulator CsrA [Anaerolineaceae bacterium]|nr:carbon storage regulator CsrA [Anaerolineaceae bacterium]
MLVLARRPNESVNIGDQVVVTILGIEGDKVKLGISAPLDIKIMRTEVYTAVQDQFVIQAHLADGPEPASFHDLRVLLANQPGAVTTTPGPLEPSGAEPPALPK